MNAKNAARSRWRSSPPNFAGGSPGAFQHAKGSGVPASPDSQRSCGTQGIFYADATRAEMPIAEMPRATRPKPNNMGGMILPHPIIICVLLYSVAAMYMLLRDVYILAVLILTITPTKTLLHIAYLLIIIITNIFLGGTYPHLPPLNPPLRGARLAYMVDYDF